VTAADGVLVADQGLPRPVTPEATRNQAQRRRGIR